jgi:hypothetical protein
MTRYVEQRAGKLLDPGERDKLLYWYIHTFLWGRYAGSTETVLAQDLGLIEEIDVQILSVDDPYNCNTNPTTGLTSSTAGVVSSYRRPLPAANLGFLSTIMCDGREPSLFSQAVDATLGHAQASAPPPMRNSSRS